MLEVGLVSDKGLRWEKRQEIPDAAVKDAAEQFDSARRLLREQPLGSGMLLPLLNNAAIALELFLKCLGAVQEWRPAGPPDGVYTIHSRSEAGGHRLVNLFNVIPDDLRSDFEEAYKACAIRSLPGTLTETLEVYEGLFKDSRYPYEAEADITKYPLNPLMDLVHFLAEFVGNRTPREWIHW